MLNVQYSVLGQNPPVYSACLLERETKTSSLVAIPADTQQSSSKQPIPSVFFFSIPFYKKRERKVWSSTVRLKLVLFQTTTSSNFLS